MPHAERYAELLKMLPGEIRMKEPEQSHEEASSPKQQPVCSASGEKKEEPLINVSQTELHV